MRSTAMISSSSIPCIISSKSLPNYIDPVITKSSLLKRTQHLPPLKITISTLKIHRSSSFKTKVYDDHHYEGISCYRDENGELVCEGYDEGPRFHQQFPTTYDPRDAEIMNILLKKWGEVVNSGGSDSTNNNKAGGVAVRDQDINWNGFHSF